MPDSTHHLKLSKLSAEYKALIEKHLKFYEQLGSQKGSNAKYKELEMRNHYA